MGGPSQPHSPGLRPTRLRSAVKREAFSSTAPHRWRSVSSVAPRNVPRSGSCVCSRPIIARTRAGRESCQDRTVPTPPIAPSETGGFHPSARGGDSPLTEFHARLSTGCPPGPVAPAWSVPYEQAKDQFRASLRRSRHRNRTSDLRITIADGQCPICRDSKVNENKKPQVRRLTRGSPWSRLRDSNPRPTHYEATSDHVAW
jgi:hypothetical protein